MAGPAVTESSIVGYQIGMCTGDYITGTTGAWSIGGQETPQVPTEGQLWPRGNS